jgi:hypothetical protein
VPAFSPYFLLQLVELFAIASYQYDFAVLNHFQCRSSANPEVGPVMTYALYSDELFMETEFGLDKVL